MAKKPNIDVPKVVDWKALERTASFLEKARLAEYVAVMSSPVRSMWLNFVAGVARGIGMVVGATIFGTILVFVLMALLKKAFLHSGGLPWVGDEVKEAIGFILRAVNEHKQAGQ